MVIDMISEGIRVVNSEFSPLFARTSYIYIYIYSTKCVVKKTGELRSLGNKDFWILNWRKRSNINGLKILRIDCCRLRC